MKYRKWISIWHVLHYLQWNNVRQRKCGQEMEGGEDTTMNRRQKHNSDVRENLNEEWEKGQKRNGKEEKNRNEEEKKRNNEAQNRYIKR